MTYIFSLFLLVTTLYSYCQCVIIPPSFTLMPEKEALYQFTEATKVMCRATAEPAPNYGWTKNFHTFQPSLNDGRYTKWPGEGTLIFAYPQQDDDGMYQCIAEGTNGAKAFSNIVNVRRAEMKDFTSKPLAEITVNAGEYVMLPCTVPLSYPQPLVQWGFKGSDGKLNIIKETNRRAIDVDGNLHIAAIDAAEDNGMVYTCTAYNSFLRLTKQGDSTRITVREGPTQERPVYNVARSPQTQLAIVNDTVLLKCIISGSPVPQYEWEKVGFPKSFVQDSNNLNVINGGTELEIKVTEASNGTYRCSGRNERTTQYAIYDYTVFVQSRPVFVVEPEDTTVPLYGSHTFYCSAKGNPTPKIEWTVNGGPPAAYLDGVRKKIENNAIMLNNLTVNDIAVVQCNASNVNGYVYKNAFINVMQERPVFIAPPQQNLKKAEGQSVNMTCQTFSAPKARVEWFKDGLSINGGRYVLQNNGDLLIDKLTIQDSGNYTCRATNQFGENIARGDLIVRERTRLLIVPIETRVYENSDVKFVCTADTDPLEMTNLVVTWYKDTNLLDTATNPRVQTNYQDNSLIISGTQPRDTGQYTCNATNGLDYAVHSAPLVIQGRPDRPQIITADCTSQISQKIAVLNWRPGADNYAPIISYIVEYATQFEDDTWYNATVAANNNDAKIALKPNIKYRFRARSKNRVGVSEPSMPTTTDCSIPPEPPAKNPDELFVYSTKTQNLIMQWTVIPYIDQYAGNLGYVLTIRCIDCASTSTSQYNTTTVADWRIDRISFENIRVAGIVSQIEINKKYEVKIKSRNDMGTSSAPETVAYGYSGGIAPTVKVAGFTLLGTGQGEIYLQFQTLSQSDLDNGLNGQFMGYRIEWCLDSLGPGDCFYQRRFVDIIALNYTSVNNIPVRFGFRKRRSVGEFDDDMDGMDGMEGMDHSHHHNKRRSVAGYDESIRLSRKRREVMSIPMNQLMNYTLTGVPGDTTIKVYIRILNNLFAGPRDTLLTVTTGSTPPDPVSDLSVTNRGVNHVEISWKLPATKNIPLTYYFIGVRELKGLDLGFLTRYPKLTDGTLTSNKVSGLRPNSTYRVYIWPGNDVGEGLETFIDIRTDLANQAPSAPTFAVNPLGPKGFNVTFEPSHTGIPGSVFFAQFRVPGENRWQQTQPVYQQRWINISNLIEDEFYEVRMVADNGADMTTASNVYLVKTSGYIVDRHPMQGASVTWFVIIILLLIIIIILVVILFLFRKKRREKLFGKQPLINDEVNSDIAKAREEFLPPKTDDYYQPQDYEEPGFSDMDSNNGGPPLDYRAGPTSDDSYNDDDYRKPALDVISPQPSGGLSSNRPLLSPPGQYTDEDDSYRQPRPGGRGAAPLISPSPPNDYEPDSGGVVYQPPSKLRPRPGPPSSYTSSQAAADSRGKAPSTFI